MKRLIKCLYPAVIMITSNSLQQGGLPYEDSSGSVQKILKNEDFNTFINVVREKVTSKTSDYSSSLSEEDFKLSI